MKLYMTSREDYLKAIYLLSQQKQKVRAVDVATYLNYSKASVSRAVALLSKENYLFVEKHGLYLTEQGKRLAEQTYDKYIFFSKQLIKLGVTPSTAHADACRLEHAISAESFEKLQLTLEK